MVADRVTKTRPLAARAGLIGLAVLLGASLAAWPVMAQDKKPAAAGEKKPAAGAPAAGAPAAAAPAAGAKTAEDQSPWVKLCEEAPNFKAAEGKDPKEAAKQKINVCLTHFESLNANSGRVLVSAAIREVEGQDKKALMIMVPLGMALPPGIMVKVDENEPVKLNYTLCHIAGCTAEAEATSKIVEEMKKGKQIGVGVVTIAGKPAVIPIPLTGFDKALAGKPIDNEKYKEARKRLMLQIRDRQVELAKKAKEEAEKKKAAGGADPAKKPQ
jgi:invasion protein IalB